jgi:hypothetical protein
MNQALTLFLKTAAEQSPILLTYIVAIFIAVICWERSPRGSALALVAMLVLLGATVGQMLVFAFLASSSFRAHDLQTASRVIWMQSAFAFAGSLLRAVGISILLGAVWAGRRPKTG